jgi:DNA-binding NtrC family response regulator
MSEAAHILVVDDHQQIRDSVTRFLEKNGLSPHFPSKALISLS